MASSWQQALLLTSLLANTSNFATIDSSTSTAPSTSTSSSVPQSKFPPYADDGANLLANIYDPLAVDAQKACSGYIATQVDMPDENTFSARLELLGEACNVYGTDIHVLDLLVEYQAQSRLHVNIRPNHMTPQNESWYLLSDAWVPAPQQEVTTIDSAELAFTWTNTPSFGFNVTRRSTNETLFSTIGHHIVYEDQFIEFVTTMDEGYNLYGLGEVIHGIRLKQGLARTIYASDAGDPVDRNMYGSHPFYLETKYYELDEQSGQAKILGNELYNTSAEHFSTSHGVWYRNTHGMEVLLGQSNVTWRTLGGEVDLYFFAGPTQPEVTSQYLQQIGLPVLQQYWTFGYHQCRWGYMNWSMTEAVVDTFAEFEIPLETIWNDIDYMKTYRNFENDPVRFPFEEGREFLQRLHDKGQHYIPIVDAAIYIPNPENASDAYEVFDNAKDQGIFLLNPDGSTYIGAVWPGFTVFPDWLSNANSSKWWHKEISDYFEKLPVDGIWIDMNEAASFCVGSCGSKNLSANPVLPPFILPGLPGSITYDYPEGFDVTNATEAVSALSAAALQATTTTQSSSSSTSYLRTTPTAGVRNVNHPPYVINHVHGDLAIHALSPNATHNNGVQQYDVHSIYGHGLLQNTYAAIAAARPGIRPFIIGRSNYVGSGNYSGHWGGDNFSKFSNMFFSIPQALSMSLFGIPMFGTDSCGFFGNTDEELCNRWMQLSAFFPFYRNHNIQGAIDQEPYVWESVAAATKKAMNIRFQLLPYLYTLFHNAHTKGETVMRALAWEFPNDPSLASADRQFFLGSAVLVTPALNQGQTSVDGVFPGLLEGTDVYYDWYNQSAVSIPSKKNTTIDAPLGHIPVYIRGGHVLVTQEMRMTTRDARKSDWSLIVAIGKNGHANSSVYLDDGISIEPNSTKTVTVNAQVGTKQNKDGKHVSDVRIDVFVNGEYSGLDLPLANVTILGVAHPPASNDVKIDDETVDCEVEYCAKTQRVLISGLQQALKGKVWANDWSLTM